MTPSERERRIEASARELYAIEDAEEQRHYESDPAAFRLGRPRPDPFERWAEEYIGKATRMLDAADEAVPVLSEAEGERLQKIEKAARWVCTNWDQEATQHLSMPALREALDGYPGAPTRAEALVTNILMDNDALREQAEYAEAAARDLAKAVRRYLTLPYERLRRDEDEFARRVLDRHPSFSGEEGTEG